MEALIGKLKKEKEAIAEKGEMGIRRIRLIIIGWRERLHKKLEENVAAKQATELQLIITDVENRKNFSTKWIKNRKNWGKDFEAMGQEQTTGIRRLLEEFDDDQLDMTLQLEAYERERKRLARQQVWEQISLSDEYQKTES